LLSAQPGFGRAFFLTPLFDISLSPTGRPNTRSAATYSIRGSVRFSYNPPTTGATDGGVGDSS